MKIFLDIKLKTFLFIYFFGFQLVLPTIFQEGSAKLTFNSKCRPQKNCPICILVLKISRKQSKGFFCLFYNANWRLKQVYQKGNFKSYVDINNQKICFLTKREKGTIVARL